MKLGLGNLPHLMAGIVAVGISNLFAVGALLNLTAFFAGFFVSKQLFEDFSDQVTNPQRLKIIISIVLFAMATVLMVINGEKSYAIKETETHDAEYFSSLHKEHPDLAQYLSDKETPNHRPSEITPEQREFIEEALKNAITKVEAEHNIKHMSDRACYVENGRGFCLGQEPFGPPSHH